VGGAEIYAQNVTAYSSFAQGADISGRVMPVVDRSIDAFTRPRIARFIHKIRKQTATLKFSADGHTAVCCYSD